MLYFIVRLCVKARKDKDKRVLDAHLSARYRSSILFFISIFFSRTIFERGPLFSARNATELMSAPVDRARTTYVTHVAAAVGSHARALVKECSTGVPPTPARAHALPSLALRARVYSNRALHV